MKTNPNFHWIILCLCVVVVMACGSSELSTPTNDILSPSTEQPATQEIQTESADTATEPPAPTEAVTTEATAANAGLSCTVLQELNLRSGPGTAYRPEIRKLPTNSVITPLGFAPKGYNGGTWAYVQDQASQDKGWVSAGAQFISCTIDLTTLPAVAFDPPPPYFPKTAQSSPGTGNGFCAGEASPGGYSCVMTFSDDYLFQVQIFKDGVEIGENEGVQPISFRVTKDNNDDNEVYSTVESNAAYCIFGGNGPCNNWIFENGALRWKSGGPPVESGEYKISVNITVNGEDSHWESFFTLDVPQ